MLGKLIRKLIRKLSGKLRKLIRKLISPPLSLLGFGLIRLRDEKTGSRDISFLHIGKTGGTQVRHITNQLADEGVRVIKQAHNVDISMIPHGSRYFFSIRNPASRFKSGFYSRKRMGLPKYRVEWNFHERMAFEEFPHANDLAESLFLEGEVGRRARAAIKSIQHTGKQQIDWFTSRAFLELNPPITIIRQEHFESDMQRFLRLVGIDQSIKNFITNDPVKAHRNSYDEVPDLSDLAMSNLADWYIQDYCFYETCEFWLRKQGQID